MMRTAFAAAIAVASACLAVALQPDAGGLVAGTLTQEIIRTLSVPDGASPIVHELLAIKLTNTGTANLTEYVFKLPIARMQHLGYILASNELLLRQELKIVIGKKTQTYQEHIVTFDPAVAPGEVLGLQVRTGYFHYIRPVPEYIEQNGKQFMFLEDTIGVDTPYPTTKFQFEFKMPTNSPPLEYPRENAKFSGRVLTYGPYDHAPGVDTPFSVRFFAPGASLVIKKLRREVWVRSLGRTLEFDDWIDVEHVGAKIKGYFSRLDTMRGINSRLSHAVHGMTLHVQKTAQDIFYRDEIGNVSSSRVGPILDSTRVVYFGFRYPLFGGWKYNWNTGYEIDYQDYFTGEFPPREPHVMHVPFVPFIPEMLFEDVETRIVLPEGVKVLKVEAETAYSCTEIFEAPATRGEGDPVVSVAGEYTLEKRHYYLDTIGRHVVVFKHSMLMFPGMAAVKVTYQPTVWSYVLKPTIVALLSGVTFLGVFMWAIGCSTPNSKCRGVAPPQRKKAE